ncbi:MAG TPA: hypothetical protein DCS09_08510 [Porphyromonadaceae bacterium]|nr:hypothetical protein [Porphyromonadaceae bacterium]
MTPQTEESYSITKASDWTMFVFLVSMLCVVIGGMWYDLKETIKESRIEWRTELKEYRQDVKAEQEKIWKAIEECKRGGVYGTE